LVGGFVSYLVRYGIRKYHEIVVTDYITSIPRDKKLSIFFFLEVVTPKNTDKIVGKRKYYLQLKQVPIPVATWPKAWVCGRSIAGIVGSNSAGGMDVSLS